MLAPSFPLRQISDDVLQELDPNRIDRPFEWRRDFNIINLVLSNPRVQVSYQLHDLAFFLGNRDPATAAPLVNAGAGVRLSIHGSVDRLDKGDTFVHTKPSSSGGDALFDTFPAQGSLQVELSACDPHEGSDVFGPGTYPGTLFAWDPKLERDTLTLSLYAPASVLTEVANSIQEGKAAGLALQIGVRVFTYEVDDALREPYHQQTFVFHGRAAPAAILRLQTLRALPSTELEDDAPPRTFSDSAVPATQHLDPALPTLSKLATPLWVIAGLLLLLALTR